MLARIIIALLSGLAEEERDRILNGQTTAGSRPSTAAQSSAAPQNQRPQAEASDQAY